MKVFNNVPLIVAFSFSLLLADSQGISVPAERDKSPHQGFADLLRADDQFCGFKKVEGPTYYSPDTLFDYINGGAELFLAYGFSALMVVEFAGGASQTQRATVDIYAMGTLENAFGVFKSEEGGEPYRLPGGSEGRLSHGLLQFYKGNFYVKVFTSPTSKDYPAVVEAIGKTIEERIRGVFSKPAFFDLLPVQNRIAGSEHYTSKDFLGQPFFKGIGSAHFEKEGKPYRIFLSVAPDKEGAQESITKYREYLIREKGYQGELPGDLEGLVGHDPYYGNCAVALIRGRIAGVLGYSGDALALLKGMGGYHE